LDSLANVLCPACKLWNTGHGANMMREAVSLMGGYGVTEDCPGFLGQKWMDAQFEATYEGPEAVQRLQLSITMTNELFLAQFKQWIREMRQHRRRTPGYRALAPWPRPWSCGTGRCNTCREATDADGAKLYHKTRQGVTFPLADALCWLLAARQFMMDVQELNSRAPRTRPGRGLPGLVSFYNDLCHAQIARAAGEVGRICAELVLRLPSASFLDRRGMQTAIGGGTKMDGCLTGARLAKDRAAEALTRVMTREALDYPA
jgi:hypothetical protein